MSTAAPKSDTVTWGWRPRLCCAREVTPRVITDVFKASCFSLKFPENKKKIPCEGISQLFLIYAVKMKIIWASTKVAQGGRGARGLWASPLPSSPPECWRWSAFLLLALKLFVLRDGVEMQIIFRSIILALVSSGAYRQLQNVLFWLFKVFPSLR